MKHCYLILFIFCFTTALAQKKQSEYLPSGHLFEPIMLDPLEAQGYASFGRALNSNVFDQGLYVPFALGFIKPIVRWQTKKNQQREFVLDAADYTQFEIYKDKSANKSRRHIINSDYKISIGFNTKINEERSYRIRIFHISSHLGDDYLLKNGYSSFYENRVNYEQVDYTYSIQKQALRYYFGAGYGFRPRFKSGYGRKRIALQAGIFWEKPMKGKENVRWVAGADLRMLEQTDFRPGIKIATGISVGQKHKNPFNFVVEYYNGPLPYSKFESEASAQLINASVYFNPF